MPSDHDARMRQHIIDSGGSQQMADRTVAKFLRERNAPAAVKKRRVQHARRRRAA